MTRTALGTLLLGSSVLSFIIAFNTGSLAPALVGLSLIAYVEGARRSARNTRLSAKRVLPTRTAIGDTMKTRALVESTADLPLEVEDQVPDAFAVLSRRSLPGRRVAEEHVVLRPRDPGTAHFEQVRVRVADPWGLHDETRTVPLPNAVAIAPEPEWAVTGKRIGRRRRVTTGVRRRNASDPSPEIETVREWLPGDRARDIDWARTSLLQKLMSKERERTTPRPIHILLDATPTMRGRRRASKLTTSARLAYAVAASAQAAGVRPTLTAFTEGRLYGAARGARGRKIETVLDQLIRLPVPTPLVDTEPLRLPEAASFTRIEGHAPQAAAPTRPGPEDPLTRATLTLTRPSAGNAFIVAILDAETRPGAAEETVRRLLHKGHKVVVVAPALGAHHFRRAEATGQVLRDLVTARLRRERLRKRLAARHVPVLSLRPDNARDIVEEVARWAQ